MHKVDVYVCISCQMLILDLYSVPKQTIIKPFAIKKNDTIEKEIEFTPSQIESILSPGDSKIEIRGIRVSKEGYKNTWPNFSEITVQPGSFKMIHSLPEREQSRKRKDLPYDFLKFINFNKHKRFKIKIQYLPNQTEQVKNNEDYTYAIGVYLVKPLLSKHIIDYHKIFE